MNFPILVDCIKNGYSFAFFKRDILSGLTVSIVAIPLSIAFAIASGATPTTGLFTAIIGGFIVSLLGGSLYNISGPAGAFICVIFNIIAHHGYNGLLISTFIAGIFLIIFSLIRAGKIISKIPNIVVIGFSLGLGIDILSGQIPDFFGFKYYGDNNFVTKWKAYIYSIKSIDIQNLFISSFTILITIFIRKKNSKLPAFLIAIIASSIIIKVFGFNIDTVYSRFGYIKIGLPEIHYSILEEVEHPLHLIQYIIPSITIALLAGIEALLAATIADNMTKTKHRSNNELFAQGVANIALSLFGCLPVAGTTARTIVNVKSGAKTPLAGIFHAIFILLFLMIFSSLISKINMATIAGILFVVAFDMMSLNKVKQIFLQHNLFYKMIIISTVICLLFLNIVSSILLNTILYYVVNIFFLKKKH